MRWHILVRRSSVAGLPEARGLYGLYRFASPQSSLGRVNAFYWTNTHKTIDCYPAVLVQIVSGLERVAGPGHRKALLECGNIRQPTEYTEGEGRSTRIGNFCHRYKHQGRHPPRKWRIPPSTANTTCSFFVGRQSWNRGEDRTSVTSTCECYWRKSTTKKSLTVKTPRGSTTVTN